MGNKRPPADLPDAVFVIRVWYDEMSGQIRTTAKNARDGTQHNFASLPLLINFLTTSKEPMQENPARG